MVGRVHVTGVRRIQHEIFKNKANLFFLHGPLSRTVRTQLCGFASHSFPPQLLRPQSWVPASHLPHHGHLSWSYCPSPSLRCHCPPPTPGPSHLSSSLALINYSTCPPTPYHPRHRIVPLVSSRLPWRRRQNVPTKSWHPPNKPNRVMNKVAAICLLIFFVLKN
jgi:hypothetical protein